MTKRKIHEQVDKIDPYDICDIESFIDGLNCIKEKYNQIGRVHLEFLYSGEYEAWFQVFVERDETDKEYQKRLKFERKQQQQKVNQKEAKLKQELQLLARLKKKYEGKE